MHCNNGFGKLSNGGDVFPYARHRCKLKGLETGKEKCTQRCKSGNFRHYIGNKTWTCPHPSPVTHVLIVWMASSSEEINPSCLLHNEWGAGDSSCLVLLFVVNEITYGYRVSEFKPGVSRGDHFQSVCSSSHLYKSTELIETSWLMWCHETKWSTRNYPRAGRCLQMNPPESIEVEQRGGGAGGRRV